MEPKMTHEEHVELAHEVKAVGQWLFVTGVLIANRFGSGHRARQILERASGAITDLKSELEREHFWALVDLSLYHGVIHDQDKRTITVNRQTHPGAE